MTIIVVPTELCNYKCRYCFEPESQRKGLDIPYSFEAISRSLHDVWRGPYGGSDVCLHGGECTMVSLSELEKLMDLIYNLPYGDSGRPLGVVNIMTNASNINLQMIQLFKKYNVYVGVSMDGPPESNLLRGPDPDNIKLTIQNNGVLMDKLKLLRDNNVPTSLICILHKMNSGDPQSVEKLLEWMHYLKSIGINGGRMNPMYSEKLKDLELTTDELVYVWKMIYHFNKDQGTRWSPVTEFETSIRGGKPSPCNFTGCDIFNTCTLSILPDGRIGNCDRTFSHGMYERSMDGNKKCGRYEALRQTQCKDCEYWNMCMGGCPEEGVDGDWRNKTRICEALKKTFKFIEDRIGIRYNQQTPIVTEVNNVPHGDNPHNDDAHGDSQHGDSQHGDSAHGDSTHGDIPHGDSTHGDNPDWRNRQ